MVLILIVPFFIGFFIVSILGTSIGNDNFRKKGNKRREDLLIIANIYWIGLVGLLSFTFSSGEFGMFFKYLVHQAGKISLAIQGLKIIIYLYNLHYKIDDIKNTTLFRNNLRLDILLTVTTVGVVLLTMK